jgi:hypothetical protein
VATKGHIAEDRLSLVKRVTDAPQFRKSPRLREFLLYACDRALADRQDELREQQIGYSVFGRRPDYNPGEDNIVRVEARKLRMRLEEYFATEGRDEPVLIEIPKGSYVPVFTPRTAERAEIAPFGDLASPAPGRTIPRRRSFWSWVQPAVIVLLAFTCLWLWYRSGARTARSPATPAPVARDLLWSAIFNDQSETTVVCADSTLVLLQKFLRRQISLPEYLDPSYPSLLRNVRASDGSVVLLGGKLYTSMADVHLVARLMQSNQPYWNRILVRSARLMNLPDFKSGNFVLLGSKRAIPWVELFEPRLNFHFDFDEAHQLPLIRNQSPRPGEKTEYINGRVGEPGDAFSFVALVPNLTYSGYVLIIAGTTMEGTEAAGEYMTNPTFCSRLLKTLGFQANSKLRPFEVLLKSSTMAGSSKDSEIIAYRIGREDEMHP